MLELPNSFYAYVHFTALQLDSLLVIDSNFLDPRFDPSCEHDAFARFFRNSKLVQLILVPRCRPWPPPRRRLTVEDDLFVAAIDESRVSDQAILCETEVGRIEPYEERRGMRESSVG